MKKITLTFISCIVLFIASSQAWSPSLTTTANNSGFYSVYFSDATHGWTVGTYYNTTQSAWAPLIYATTDGGTTWAQQTAPNVNTTLTDVFFIDNLNGWATSSGNVPSSILKTTDGGATWTDQTSGVSALYGVYFQSATLGWAVGSGYVVKSTDGGITWVNQNVVNSGDLFDIHFTDSQNGYITGVNEILRTTNGGANWTSTATSNTVWRRIGEIDANTVHFAGYNNSTGSTIKTTNGGSSYTNFSSLTSGTAMDIKFLDANTGYLVTQSGVVSKTTNGGGNWANDYADNTYSFQGIHIINGTNIFAVGRNVGDNTAVIHRYSACGGATAPVITSIGGLSTSQFSPPCAGTTFTFTAGGATDNVVWTLPSDWTITTGAGTNTITGTYGQIAGTVSITATNVCNLSTIFTSGSVTPTVGIPSQPTSINPSDPHCLEGSFYVSLSPTPASGNGTTWSWSANPWTDLNTGNATLNPFGSFSLNSASSGSVTVVVNNACGSSAPLTQTFNFSLDAQLPDPVISEVGGIISTTSVATEYCWYEIDSESEFCFTGATGMNFTPTFSGDYYLVISTANGCPSTSNTISVTIDGTSSINENEIHTFNVSPNPASTTVSINDLEIGSTIQIADMTGKIVSEKLVSSTEMTFDLNDLNNGIYFVQLANNSEITSSKKLIVNK
jgi:photosystem II stability/assembly factor-like uncharacterized protein